MERVNVCLAAVVVVVNHLGDSGWSWASPTSAVGAPPTRPYSCQTGATSSGPPCAGHSIQRCSAPSSPSWQSWQVGSSVRPTMVRHLPSLGWWPVLKRVRFTLPARGSWASSASLNSLVYTSLSLSCLTGLPRTSLLMRARLVDPSIGMCSCWCVPPSAVSLSASSLPGTPQCPGTHTRVTDFLSPPVSKVPVSALSHGAPPPCPPAHPPAIGCPLRSPPCFTEGRPPPAIWPPPSLQCALPRRIELQAAPAAPDQLCSSRSPPYTATPAPPLHTPSNAELSVKMTRSASPASLIASSASPRCTSRASALDARVRVTPPGTPVLQGRGTEVCLYFLAAAAAHSWVHDHNLFATLLTTFLDALIWGIRQSSWR